MHMIKHMFKLGAKHTVHNGMSNLFLIRLIAHEGPLKEQFSLILFVIISLFCVARVVTGPIRPQSTLGQTGDGTINGRRLGCPYIY